MNVKTLLAAIVGVAIFGFVVGCHHKNPEPTPATPTANADSCPNCASARKAGAAPVDTNTKNINVGGNFELLFKEDQGKKWIPLTVPAFLKLTDENKKTPDDKQEFQERRFVYTGTAAGTGDLVIVYRNGTEATDAELDRRTISVTVK